MANTPPTTPRPRAGQGPLPITRPTTLRAQTEPRPLTMKNRLFTAAACSIGHNARQDASLMEALPQQQAPAFAGADWPWAICRAWRPLARWLGYRRGQCARGCGMVSISSGRSVAHKAASHSGPLAMPAAQRLPRVHSPEVAGSRGRKRQRDIVADLCLAGRE